MASKSEVSVTRAAFLQSYSDKPEEVSPACLPLISPSQANHLNLRHQDHRNGSDHNSLTSPLSAQQAPTPNGDKDNMQLICWKFMSINYMIKSRL